MLPCFRRMLRPNIFYTAVTRAKKKVLIVGSNGTLRGVEGEGQTSPIRLSEFIFIL